MYINIFLLLILCALTAASPLPTSNLVSRQTGRPLVDLGYAQYQGINLAAGVNQYLSMRYAAPPM
jgi:acetylcholinesterase